VAGWARRVPEGWLLAVHVQPGAKTTGVAGLHGEDLKIRIAAPPVEGRANAALEEFIARALGIPKRCVSVVKGGASRRKTVQVAAPQADPELLRRGKT
jgi:uncharacterized protein (TIGR00251 family)